MTPEENPPQQKASQGKSIPWVNKYPNALRLGAPLLLLVSLIFLIETIVYKEKQHTFDQHQKQLRDNAHELRALFENELFSTLHLTTGLVSYIQSKQGVITAPELDPWLTNLQERANHIRNIGIAPKNRIQFVYPLAGNEAALGLYYPESKEQWPAVEKIMREHRPILAGPLTLKQGGLGLVYRVPIFLNNDSQYWGLVSTVLDFDALYATLHKRAQELQVRINVSDNESAFRTLFGDTLNTREHQEKLNIPGRQWLLSIESKTPISYKLTYNIRLTGWLLSFFFAGMFYALLKNLQHHQKIQEDLHHSETRFSQIFNSAPQGIALVRFTGEIRNTNQGLAYALGYNLDELLSKNFFDIAAPSQRERISHILEGINPLNASHQQYESVLMDKQGNHINVILSLSPTEPNLYESDWIIQVIDISYRVSFEHRLQEEAQYNHTLVSNLLDSILIVNEQGYIVDANPAAHKLFDVSTGQLPQHHINQLIQYPTPGKTIHHITSQKNNQLLNSLHPQELLGLKLTGNLFPIDVLISTGIRKSELMYIIVIRDISERKRLEKLKQELISNISHELRTPLTSIAGTLGILHSGKLESFSEPVKKIVAIAEQNCQKLTRLINELLDLDKLISGKMQFTFEHKLLSSIIETTLEELSAYFDKYQVRASFTPIDATIYVNIDTHRFQQVLSNLLSNAAKYSPPNGEIKVNISVLAANVRIEIIDQGPGIALEAQANLFQKFYQVENANGQKMPGTGLGLAIAKELISAMNGKIGVISDLGKGSCFYVELPMIDHRKNSEQEI